VVGVAGAGGGELDDACVFLHLRDAQDLFVLGEAAHQVVVALPRGSDPRAAAATLRAALPADRYEALAWNEIVPDVEAAIRAAGRGCSRWTSWSSHRGAGASSPITFPPTSAARVLHLLSLGTRPSASWRWCWRRRCTGRIATLWGGAGAIAGQPSAPSTSPRSGSGSGTRGVASRAVQIALTRAVRFAAVTVFSTILERIILGGCCPP
jgi:hypothetical protein